MRKAKRKVSQREKVQPERELELKMRRLHLLINNLQIQCQLFQTQYKDSLLFLKDTMEKIEEVCSSECKSRQSSTLSHKLYKALQKSVWKFNTNFSNCKAFSDYFLRFVDSQGDDLTILEKNDCFKGFDEFRKGKELIMVMVRDSNNTLHLKQLPEDLDLSRTDRLVKLFLGYMSDMNFIQEFVSAQNSEVFRTNLTPGSLLLKQVIQIVLGREIGVKDLESEEQKIVMIAECCFKLENFGNIELAKDMAVAFIQNFEIDKKYEKVKQILKSFPMFNFSPKSVTRKPGSLIIIDRNELDNSFNNFFRISMDRRENCDPGSRRGEVSKKNQNLIYSPPELFNQKILKTLNDMIEATFKKMADMGSELSINKKFDTIDELKNLQKKIFNYEEFLSQQFQNALRGVLMEKSKNESSLTSTKPKTFDIGVQASSGDEKINFEKEYYLTLPMKNRVKMAKLFSEALKASQREISTQTDLDNLSLTAHFQKRDQAFEKMKEECFFLQNKIRKLESLNKILSDGVKKMQKKSNVAMLENNTLRIENEEMKNQAEIFKIEIQKLKILKPNDQLKMDETVKELTEELETLKKNYLIVKKENQLLLEGEKRVKMEVKKTLKAASDRIIRKEKEVENLKKIITLGGDGNKLAENSMKQAFSKLKIENERFKEYNKEILDERNHLLNQVMNLRLNHGNVSPTNPGTSKQWIKENQKIKKFDIFEENLNTKNKYLQKEEMNENEDISLIETDGNLNEFLRHSYLDKKFRNIKIFDGKPGYFKFHSRITSRGQRKSYILVANSTSITGIIQGKMKHKINYKQGKVILLGSVNLRPI